MIIPISQSIESIGSKTGRILVKKTNNTLPTAKLTAAKLQNMVKSSVLLSKSVIPGTGGSSCEDSPYGDMGPYYDFC